MTMTLNLQTVTDQFAAAVDRAERLWAVLRIRKFNERILIRYVRALRRCDRLRVTLKTMIEEGTL